MPEVRESLDAAAIRAWCLSGAEALRVARQEIDAINVYPVPDGDTGTNLHLTMRAVADAVEAAPDAPVEELLGTIARAALMGAKGNSGVILSQLLRGFVEILSAAATEQHALDAALLQSALDRAADRAYDAVTKPVEGTILTVARAAALGARACHDGDVAMVARAAASEAATALTRTPEQLSSLADAGVVDAGGRGLVLLLDTLVYVLDGGQAPAAEGQPPPLVDRTVLRQAREVGSDEFAFEVMYLLDADEDVVPGLRGRLELIGDSVLVVGADGLWNVHVHVNDVGAAIEAGIAVGRPHRIVVTHFAHQVESQEHRLLRSGRAVVAVVPGGGLAALYADAGAAVVPSTSPDERAILSAIHESGAEEVVLLPNGEQAYDAIEAAARSARAEGRSVAIVPTRASVQGLAALAVHDVSRAFDDDVIAMTAAARATRHGEVVPATEDALTSAGPCKAGDILGFLDGDVALMGSEVFGVSCAVLDRLLIGGGELVTLVTGEAAPTGLGERLVEYLRATRPAVEAIVYAGGRSQPPLLVGVE